MAYAARPKVASRPRMDRSGDYIPEAALEPSKPKKRKREPRAFRKSPEAPSRFSKPMTRPATWGQIKVEYLGKDDEE